MERRSALLLIALATLLVTGTLALATQDTAQKPPKIGKDQCLGCHGPYEKIRKATADYETTSGEKVTPHQYVAHDTTDIPECTECHTPHAIPLEDKSTVVKPKNVDWCYTSCHHAQNLQPCKNCH